LFDNSLKVLLSSIVYYHAG